MKSNQALERLFPDVAKILARDCFNNDKIPNKSSITHGIIATLRVGPEYLKTRKYNCMFMVRADMNDPKY